MNTPRPRAPRKRRKQARPAEIIEAALQVFGERGFGAARLEDVARLAGVSKGTVLFYFSNKEELFRAVAQSVLTIQLSKVSGLASDLGRPLGEFIPLLLKQVANVMKGGLPPIARLILAESKAFPDLARVWHDEVASKVLQVVTNAIESAQERGEIRPGDARLHAFSIMGPMMAATLFREVFGETGAVLPDLDRLAEQHAATILRGLLMEASD